LLRTNKPIFFTGGTNGKQNFRIQGAICGGGTRSHRSSSHSPCVQDEDYEHVLEQVDAVYLALPNHLHKEYAVRAADAGVHVLCEKPMAVTEQECEAMINAAQNNGVKLMVAYRLHFEKGNLEAISDDQEKTPGKAPHFYL